MSDLSNLPQQYRPLIDLLDQWEVRPGPYRLDDETYYRRACAAELREVLATLEKNNPKGIG